MIQDMNPRGALRVICGATKPRRNNVLEFTDSNAVHPRAVHPTVGSPPLDLGELLRELRRQLNREISPSAGPSDWVASCSFSKTMTFPLLGLSNRFFLDSSYGLERREKMLLTELCSTLKERGIQYSDFIIAANATELDNMGGEFGITVPGLPDRAKALADALSERSGTRMCVLLQTATYGTVVEPGQAGEWRVPTFDISVKRRTNAGSTFAGAFLAAYDALGDFRPAVFFANAVTAKRLSDDELPNRENVLQFLKAARMKSMPVAGTIGLDQLKRITSSRKA